MKVLFLDDDESRHDVVEHWPSAGDVTHVRTVDQALKALRRERFDVVCLDHDLGGQQMVESHEGTGYHVAQAIAKEPAWHLGRVIVHSWNPEGARRMAEKLREAGLDVVRIPFGGFRV